MNWQLVGGRAWYRDLAEELTRLHGKPSSEKDETPKNEVRREKAPQVPPPGGG